MVSSDADAPSNPPTPSPFNYILSFLLVGICWGFTTPFIRKAAVNYTAPSHPSITDPNRSWISRQIAKAFYTVIGLLKSPGYAVPLVMNLTGSIWFFLLVGQAVLGEWYAEGKLISRDTWIGMILVCVGIGLCVWSKS
ncbi:hypothetical protein HRR82_005994 [Exophiala dermatitidis]|nr:hypothetical protein HRR82_005994 [Exophiala dermatitidis]